MNLGARINTIRESDYDPHAVIAARERFIVVTGCSGGGKSSIIDELSRRGLRTVPEPGRQVIREQNAIGGDATPQGDWQKFIEFTISRTIHQMILAATASDSGIVFFDRSIVDQVNAFPFSGLPIPPHLARAVEIFRYGKVFVVPPWPELFKTDAERKHSFDEALAHYEPLLKTYEQLGYPLTIIPQASVAERADFVLAALG